MTARNGGSRPVVAAVPADRTTDAALVGALVPGDPAASAAFVRRFQAGVYGLALSITRDPVLAADVARDAFVRACRAAATYDPARASATTWLLSITRRVAIAAARAHPRPPYSRRQLEQHVQHPLDRGNPTTAAVDEEDARHSLQRLARHHPEQARAVVLAVVCGCTAAEVATHERIPLETAKTRIRTGLQQLRTSPPA